MSLFRKTKTRPVISINRKWQPQQQRAAAVTIIFHFHAAVHLFCLSLFLTAPPRLPGQIVGVAAHEKRSGETAAPTETFNFLAENLPHVALFFLFFSLTRLPRRLVYYVPSREKAIKAALKNQSVINAWKHSQL